MKDFFGQIHRALDLGGAPGEHDAPGNQILEAGATQLGLDQGEQFVVARLYHLGQILAAEGTGRPVAHAGHLDGFVRTGQLGQCAGVLDLDFVRVLLGGPQGHGDIVGHLVPGNGNVGGVTDGPFGEDGDIRGPATDIHDADTQFTLVFSENGVSTR